MCIANKCLHDTLNGVWPQEITILYYTEIPLQELNNEYCQQGSQG